jgi:hypothetical protein
MSSALLSRFDLIFILMDKPDEEMDHFLSEHVMAVGFRLPLLFFVPPILVLIPFGP